MATPYTPLVPLETSRLLDDGCDVVARPVHPSVPPVPIYVKLPVKGAERDSDEVAMLPSFAGVPFEVVQYARLPATSAEEVARYEERVRVPVVVIVPPESPVPAVMEVTPLLIEEVATH